MPLADLLARLPSPIALPLHSYLEETDPRLKLWAMCDTVELLLRLLVGWQAAPSPAEGAAGAD